MHASPLALGATRLHRTPRRLPLRGRQRLPAAHRRALAVPIDGGDRRTRRAVSGSVRAVSERPPQELRPRPLARVEEPSAEPLRPFVSDLDGEEALVEKARSGDRGALGSLLQHHGPRLYRAVLLPRLGSEAAARDALSETYAKVCANITKFTWQAKGFYPWLRVIALNTALDQLRGRKRTLLWSPEDVQTELDATNTATPLDAKLSEARDRAAAKERVTKALEKINERYAMAIRLRVLEERSREEVAATLDVTVATFDVVLHRALAALRKVLEGSKEGGER